MKALIQKSMYIVASGALFAASSLSAFFGNNGCCPVDPCCDNGPLRCNAFSVQVKGGVAPSHYTSRGRVWLTNPSADPAVFSNNKIPSFNKQFQTPWQVGAEIAWNASTHVQFFGEYAFQRASGKVHNFTSGVNELSQDHSDYETNAFYLGARYYFNNVFCSDCWGTVAPFGGFKGGFVWQKGVSYDIAVNDVDRDTFTYYKRQAAVSAGAQIGLDWSINCAWGILFTAEAVVTQGLKNSRNNVLDPAVSGGLTNVNLGETGRIVSFPLTLGVRYTF